MTRATALLRSGAFVGVAVAMVLVGAVFGPEMWARGNGQVTERSSDGSGAVRPADPSAPDSAAPTGSADPTPSGRSGGPSRSAKKPRKKATVPTAGSGRFQIADLTRSPSSEQGRTITYQVRVERDLPFDPKRTAKIINGILDDERSWTGGGQVRFRLVGKDADPDLKILLATPKTTDRYCLPLDTGGRLSCQVEDRVVLNGKRWAKAVKDYASDVGNYRRYLVNHEVGHFLGHDHVTCPARGQKAPVMMQQTKGLKGCTKNVWPTGER